MANMLQLPRELYLMICSYLSPREQAILTQLSRDHYVATQAVLFDAVHIHTFRALLRLVAILQRTPVVSQISAKQRLRWDFIRDGQLQDRVVNSLSVELDCWLDPDHKRFTGVLLEHLLGAVVRKCAQVSIALTLNGVWRNFTRQMLNATFPAVRTFNLYTGLEPDDDFRLNILTVVFSGATFPNLKMVRLNDRVHRAELMPTSLEHALDLCVTANPSFSSNGVQQVDVMKRMESIALEFNNLISGSVLTALFQSTSVPQALSSVEIVNCPNLSMVEDLDVLATLLKRTLQRLQHLKLHIVPIHPGAYDVLEPRYISRISDQPGLHLCNIVRQIGRTIASLDLSLPFACNRMIPPSSSRVELEPPLEPYRFTPAQVRADGCKYRRLIFWDVCQGAHEWEDMTANVGRQAGDLRWQIIAPNHGGAAFCASGHELTLVHIDHALALPF